MEKTIRKEEVCYGILHNRKTAGTALKHIISLQKQRTPDLKAICFGHVMTYPQFIKEYPHAKAVFFVRDPISRFVSGFYSRLRQGQPRYYFPWKKQEAKAFARFNTPNHLAEALSSSNPWTRYTARHAMNSIGHVKHTYVNFFGPLSFLERTANRIAFIGHQPDFDTDLPLLRQLLEIHSDIQPPTDDKAAHRNPSNLDLFLSEKAIANLNKWYKKDFDIYAWCLKKRKNLQETVDNEGS